MADVFVSYSRNDKARVAPLVAAIEAQGWSVWWDPEIAPGQDFDREIAAELAHATAVVVVWTPTSVQSRWVRGEAREAAERGILVPVRFEGATLPIDVRAIHTTDFAGPVVDAESPQVRELLRALGALVGRSATASVPKASGPAASAVASSDARVAICVLPFANMSGDPEQEYFSDGITEDVITDLSKVSALAVISRNSAFMYKGKHVDVPQVARDLRVSHILEGSVRKAGGRVRISAQLIDGATNQHVWAERYDRELNDIFTLQDEISQAIVKAMKVKLLPEEKKAIEQRGTDNVEAYNLYLMARQYYVNSHDADAHSAESIIRLTLRATELDPGYARAWAMLSIAQRMLRFAGKAGDNGLAAAERAIALDANLAEAHAAKSRVLLELARHDEASAELDIAVRLDPESYEVNRTAGKLRYRQQRIPEAIRYYEKALALMDADVSAPGMLLSCYTAVGDRSGAVRVAQITLARTQKALAHDQNNGAAMALGAYALATLGESERAKEWMNRAMLIDPDNVNARYNFACALTCQLQETDAALELLRPMFATISRGFLDHAMTDPDLKSLRDDPRFKTMVAEAEARLAAAGE
jgi:adenylate cyclase